MRSSSFVLLTLLLLIASACDVASPIEEPAAPQVAYVSPGGVGATRLHVRPAFINTPRPLSLSGVREGVPRIKVFDAAREDSVPLVPLPTDATIYSMGAVRWSPDGTRVAATVNSGPDQSEVVVFDLAGGGRGASPETQYVGTVAWSPDGRRIAYTMTTSGPGVVRLFVTDLTTFRVTAIAPDEPLDYVSELAWSADGAAVFFTRSESTDGPGVRQSVLRAEVASGTVRRLAEGVAGWVTDIDPTGDRLLVTRIAGERRSLHEVTVGTGASRPLVEDADVAYARYASGAGVRPVLAFADDGPGVRAFRIDPRTGARRPLPGLERWASADLFGR